MAMLDFWCGWVLYPSCWEVKEYYRYACSGVGRIFSWGVAQNTVFPFKLFLELAMGGCKVVGALKSQKFASH